ncbi:hypothetical protein [Sinorhizobium medicae]|uniref:Phasin domain-containing protein n=1 Tax=Sinorhizobium medicae TaxID=110321 RepID=A0ABX4TH47_9HYPH|nr:hypothetical protein [Sinorhizobium medicae]PLT97184.1 hypothetical protein BMJ33_26365 [Sinorhizobium medicae]PLU23634.1 hypothetical protein BMJ29_04495 [Sinorhizobium medicae]PLU79518.1 hypothetical protein BMJ19_12480 [Sinorhizobium medicae]
MTMSPDFPDALEAATNSEPFELVSLRDLLRSSPEFLLSLSVIDLFRTSTNAAIPPAVASMIEDLDEQVIFTTEMVRAGLVTIARLMGEEAEQRSGPNKEALEAACQLFTEDSVRLSTLLILKDTVTAPAMKNARARVTNASAIDAGHQGNTAATETIETAD